MNNTKSLTKKRIHRSIHTNKLKFYIPLYIPPELFQKIPSSITSSSAFIVLQTSPSKRETSRIKPKEKHLKSFFPTFDTWQGKQIMIKLEIGRNGKRFENRCTNIVIVSTILLLPPFCINTRKHVRGRLDSYDYYYRSLDLTFPRNKSMVV